jgi:hypothetical protein
VNGALIWRGAIWVASLSAVAGVVADVVTSTLFYWPLLAPAYVMIFLSAWRASRPGAWRLARPDALGTERLPRLTPLSVIGRIVMLPLRLLGALGMVICCAAPIWAVIAFLTWAKPFWQVYVPVMLVLAVIVWLIWREGQPRRRRRHPDSISHAPHPGPNPRP